MKVLVVSQYFYPENFRINDLCFGLKNLGHEVEVLTGKPNYPKGNFYKGYSWNTKKIEIINGIKVYRSNLISRGNSGGFRLFLNYISFVFFGSIKLFSIKQKFDKIFVYAPSPITVGFIGVLASFIFRAKPFLWVHDLWPESLKDAGGIKNKIILGLVNLMTKSIYFFYDTILVQSPRFKDYMIEQGVSKNKIFYYPYYAESFYKVVKPKSSVKSIFPKGLNILFAGNIGVAQSFDTIISAADKIRSIKNNINFIIIGEGRDKKRLIEKISKMSLENNFKFLGSFPPEKMSDYFACADVLLVSLKKSKIFKLTIPGKLQSYLACGKPIIGSIDGICSDIIMKSKSGYSSPSENSDMLAKAIIRFSNLTKKEESEMGKNARKYFEKEFERNKLLLKLIDIFKA